MSWWSKAVRGLESPRSYTDMEAFSLVCYLFSSPPSLEKMVFDPKIIKDLANLLMNNIFDGFWMVVKRGHGEQDMSPQIISHTHKLEVSIVKRCLPDQQSQFSFFLICTSCSLGTGSG